MLLLLNIGLIFIMLPYSLLSLLCNLAFVSCLILLSIYFIIISILIVYFYSQLIIRLSLLYLLIPHLLVGIIHFLQIAIGFVFLLVSDLLLSLFILLLTFNYLSDIIQIAGNFLTINFKLIITFEWIRTHHIFYFFNIHTLKTVTFITYFLVFLHLLIKCFNTNAFQSSF